jgi:MOSC domain-containing protein YiiM
VSVNVGAPRVVDWYGRRVRTAIYKEPVPGPIVASGVNLEGDAQADRRVHGGHDKAIYAYALEDYLWWSGQLGCELGPGTFGDNLTTADLDVTGSTIGDRWVIGGPDDGAVLEVSQPREPCFKLGIRMGDAAFVDRFAVARRPGTYLRIIEPGPIAAGDGIAVTRAEAPAVAIVDLVGDLTPELLAQVAADERAPDGWRHSARRALARAPRT